jgi:hypothetical protein
MARGLLILSESASPRRVFFPEPGRIVKPSLGMGPDTQPKAMADIRVYAELDINPHAS